MNTFLSITGSDCTGVSGVQADIKTAAMLGVGITTAVTCITVQSTLGIQSYFDVPADTIKEQIEAVFNDEKPYIVKIGMMRSTDVVNIVATALKKYKPQHIIFDPVTLSTNGDLLMDDEVKQTILQHILPLCSILIVRPDNEMTFNTLTNNCKCVINDLVRTHGNSNMFSSSVAAYLCRGENLEHAVNHAKDFLRQQSPEHSAESSRIATLYNHFLDDVEQYHDSNSDVGFYADRLDISPRYLAQITRKMVSRSPKTIIDERLANHIETLLVSSNMTVQQISYQLNFSSQAHLSKFFRTVRGTTPSHYRKQQRLTQNERK